MERSTWVTEQRDPGLGKWVHNSFAILTWAIGNSGWSFPSKNQDLPLPTSSVGKVRVQSLGEAGSPPLAGRLAPITWSQAGEKWGRRPAWPKSRSAGTWPLKTLFLQFHFMFSFSAHNSAYYLKASLKCCSLLQAHLMLGLDTNRSQHQFSSSFIETGLYLGNGCPAKDYISHVPLQVTMPSDYMLANRIWVLVMWSTS